VRTEVNAEALREETLTRRVFLPALLCIARISRLRTAVMSSLTLRPPLKRRQHASALKRLLMRARRAAARAAWRSEKAA